MARQSSRYEKPTVQVPPVLATTPGGMILADAISKIGGTLVVDADGTTTINVPDGQDEAARDAVAAFERIQQK